MSAVDREPLNHSVQPHSTSFNLQSPVLAPSFIEVPLTEDISFEYIQLDLERLNRIKKTSFWTHLLNVLQPHLRFGETLTIDNLIAYYPNYEQPLFTVKSALHFFVEKIYNWVVKVINEQGQNQDRKIKNIVSLCLEKEKVLTDETFLTIIKMLRKNPNKESEERAWQLLACVSNSLLPSEDFIYALYNYYVSVIDNHPEERAKEWARYCLKRCGNKALRAAQVEVPQKLRAEHDGDRAHEGGISRRGRSWR